MDASSTVEDRLVPTKEAAAALHLHEVTVRRHVRDGVLPGVKIGHRYFVSTKTLDRLLADQPRPTKAP